MFNKKCTKLVTAMGLTLLAGTSLSFMFDAKRGYISGESTAEAFIRTLDSDASFALTNNVLLNTTSLNSVWGTFICSAC